MGAPVQRPTEVFRVPSAMLWTAVFLALLFQAFLPVRFPVARLIDFPLLVTIYFALVRRNKVFAIALGTGLGLMQDALSHGFIGIFGMAKAVVGYLAAASSVRFEIDSVVTRSVLTGIFVFVQSIFLLVLTHALLESSPPFRLLDLISSTLINVALGLAVYQFLDRFKVSA